MRFSKLGLLFVLCLPLPLGATTHVWVETDEGVWLASDTLIIHTSDDGIKTNRTACKVVLSPGRMIFNAGGFRNWEELQKDESLLPNDEIDVTTKKLLSIMLGNHKDYLLNNPGINPKGYSEFVWVIQVGKNGFKEARCQETIDQTESECPRISSTIGVPYGIGKVVDFAKARALQDESYRKQILANPKVELIKLLDAEALVQNGKTAPPYSVFLLHPDGTVSDYSDQHVCEIPKEVTVRNEHVSPRPNPNSK